MPFWRRDAETLNERLAREAGVSTSGEPADAPAADAPTRSAAAEEKPETGSSLVSRLMQPISDLAAIHGVARAREWDAVATVEIGGIRGHDAVHFVALPTGALVVDENVRDDALAVLAEAVERQLEPPYRAEAVRTEGDVWAIGARRTVVVELPDRLTGEELELTVHHGERTLMVDGKPSTLYFPALEDLADPRHASFVVRAVRLDRDLWEVDVSPL